MRHLMMMMVLINTKKNSLALFAEQLNTNLFLSTSVRIRVIVVGYFYCSSRCQAFPRTLLHVIVFFFIRERDQNNLQQKQNVGAHEPKKKYIYQPLTTRRLYCGYIMSHHSTQYDGLSYEHIIENEHHVHPPRRSQ